MSKKSLIDSLALQMNCSRSEATQFINTYQAIMIEQLNHHGEFTLPGIGSIKRKTRAARNGRNPRTGESITIPERQVVQFKANTALLRLINQ